MNVTHDPKDVTTHPINVTFFTCILLFFNQLQHQKQYKLIYKQKTQLRSVIFLRSINL
jgi:hypothetical protein